MAPDSYLAVIAPESAAAILKQEPAAIPQIAGQLTLSPQQLTTLGLAHGTLALAHRDTDPR
jgi:acetyl-CoA carboxylase carboxyl transferase subunit beta